MTQSYTITHTQTFTQTHAKQIAASVATDLSRFRRFYGSPSAEWIVMYETEMTLLLKADYLDNVTYGFQRNGKWVEALRYRALPGGYLQPSDDPGKIRPGIDVSNLSFGSYLVRNSKWSNLTTTEQVRFDQSLPFQRVGAVEPPLESGFWIQGNVYAAGGRGVARSTIMRFN